MRVATLHVGDSVTTYHGNKIAIAAIDIVAKRTTVHNFEVADYHTYYVSHQQVLVHNNGPCDNVLKPDGKQVGHHSDPKLMGGDANQKLTRMSESEHKALHKDLNEHLVKYKNEAGQHLRPQRGNSGGQIQTNFSKQERNQAMKDFYTGSGAKYKQAASDYAKQHP